jgi:hypothetical protein
MVGGAKLDSVVVQAVVKLGQSVKVFNLKGHVVQTKSTGGDRCGVGGGLEQGQVVMNLAASQEGPETFAIQRDVKTQNFRVKLGGHFLIPDVDYQMAYSLNAWHSLSSRSSCVVF